MIRGGAGLLQLAVSGTVQLLTHWAALAQACFGGFVCRAGCAEGARLSGECLSSGSRPEA